MLPITNTHTSTKHAPLLPATRRRQPAAGRSRSSRQQSAVPMVMVAAHAAARCRRSAARLHVVLQTVATSPRALRLSVTGRRHRVQTAEMEVLCAAAAAEQAQAKRRVLSVAAVAAGTEAVVAQPRVAALHQSGDRQHSGRVRRPAGARRVQRNAAAAAKRHRLRRAGRSVRRGAIALGAHRCAVVGL